MSGKLAWEVTKGTVTEFMEDKALRLSAALAYYAVFSLAPLLIIVIAVAGVLFDQEAVRGEVKHQIEGFVGAQSAKTIESMIAAQKHGTSVIATIVGLVTLLLGASGVFGQLQDALNTIWEVQPKPGRGIWGFVKDRFLSLAMVLGTGFLLLISMVISALIEASTGAIGHVLAVPGFVASLMNVIVSFAVITLLFAMIFKVLPDVRVQWRDVWIGAICTALLFTLGKYLLGLYLGRESTASAYGAAGSFVVILLWVYYSSVILFMGAEFTQVYATKTGSKIVPTENAIPVTEEARANQGMPSRERVQAMSNPQSRESQRAEAKPQRAYAHLDEQRGAAGMQELSSSRSGQTRATLPFVRQKSWRSTALALGVGVMTGWAIVRDLRARRRNTSASPE